MNSQIYIGIPKETLDGENRLPLTPDALNQLFPLRNLNINMQHRAGAGIRLEDSLFRGTGARMMPADQLWEESGVVLKVKDLTPPEKERISNGGCRKGQTVVAFHHPGSDLEGVKLFAESGMTCISYDLLKVGGVFPILKAMSEIAGRSGVQMAHDHEPDRRPSGEKHCLIFGGGDVGLAAKMKAEALGYTVTLVEKNEETATTLAGRLRDEVIWAETTTFETRLASAHIIIGGAIARDPSTLTPFAPKTLQSGQMERLRPYARLVDVAIDEGGNFPIEERTTWETPFVLDKRGFYFCNLPNIPGGKATALEATKAISELLVPWAHSIAEKGVLGALREHPELQAATFCHGGHVTNEHLASKAGVAYKPLSELL